jgi:lysosomal acid lipase/cholesteryl ester hydrolase
LIESWGFQAEEHFVTTEDGYTLALHRIPGRIQNGLDPEGQKRIPVLLGHCLVGTSAIWAFGPVENSLAYLLAEQGLFTFTTTTTKTTTTLINVLMLTK